MPLRVADALEDGHTHFFQGPAELMLRLGGCLGQIWFVSYDLSVRPVARWAIFLPIMSIPYDRQPTSSFTRP